MCVVDVVMIAVVVVDSNIGVDVVVVSVGADGSVGVVVVSIVADVIVGGVYGVCVICFIGACMYTHVDGAHATTQQHYQPSHQR